MRDSGLIFEEPKSRNNEHPLFTAEIQDALRARSGQWARMPFECDATAPLHDAFRDFDFRVGTINFRRVIWARHREVLTDD